MPLILNLGGLSVDLGGSSTEGNPFDQSLNTEDSVIFQQLEVADVHGGSLSINAYNGEAIGYRPDINNPYGYAWQINGDGSANFANGNITIDPYENSLNLLQGGLWVNGSEWYNSGVFWGYNGLGYNGYLNWDGSAQFANGALWIDASGNLGVGHYNKEVFTPWGSWFEDAPSASLGVDGSASFAQGHVGVDTFGNIYSQGDISGNSLSVLPMGAGGSISSLNSDGSASFANGAAQINSDGSASFANGAAYIWPEGFITGNGVVIAQSGNQQVILDGQYGGISSASTAADWYIYGYALNGNPYSIWLDSGNITSDGSGNLHVNSITTATGGGGNPFDQSLNTSNAVTFASASFANGYATIDSYGRIIASCANNPAPYGYEFSLYPYAALVAHGDIGTNDGNIYVSGAGASVFVNDGAVCAPQMYIDGANIWDAWSGLRATSASFANGAAGFDASGNLYAANFSGGGGGGGGNPFDQSLNTTDSVTFSNLSATFFDFAYGSFQAGNTVFDWNSSSVYIGVHDADPNNANMWARSSNTVLGVDGSAYFANGASGFDSYGNLTAQFANLSWLNVSTGDGSSRIWSEGSVLVGPWFSQTTALNPDGSASFAAGAATIDTSGVFSCGNPVSGSSDNSVDSKVEIIINGTTYYLLASTSAN